MGKQNSKLKPEVLEDLRQNTEFSGESLGNLWKTLNARSAYQLYSIQAKWHFVLFDTTC